MNLREKPLFQYIARKQVPISTVRSDSILMDRENRLQRMNQEEKYLEHLTATNFKPLTVPELSYGMMEKALTVSKVLGHQYELVKQTIDTFMLYDRIAKQCVTLNVNYVERVGVDDEGVMELLGKGKENGKESGKGKENGEESGKVGEKQLKEGDDEGRKRVSISTRLRLGTLISSGMPLISEINNLRK